MSKEKNNITQSVISDDALAAMDELSKQSENHLNGWKKALADYQNLQKETAQKMQDLRGILLIDIVKDLLPIFDNYYLGLQHIPEKERKEAWAVGLDHVWRQWSTWLESVDIKKIESIGAMFDPHLHEAIGQVNEPTKADNIVLSEQLSGYIYQDQLIRPAKVVVNNLSNK